MDFKSAVLDETVSMQDLICAWERSFMNYTPDAPDRWRDPLKQYDGDFDHPDCAVPYLLRRLREQGCTRECIDQALAYLQFYAAVYRKNYTDTNTAPVRKLILQMPEQDWLAPLKQAL